ncbi:hypothetical protein SLS62_010525, partial [Diatrype stigma]
MPSIVFFAGDELAFWCSTGATCQCGADTARLSADKFGTINSPKVQFSIHFGSHIDESEAHSTVRNLADGGVEGFGVSQTWRNMVKYYSELKLTTASDRLLAIGAVAEQVQSKRPGDQYLAGLWRNSLHRDLLWMTPEEAFHVRGPTWSWASWSSKGHSLKIKYGHYDHIDLKPLAEILETTCNYVDNNPFGAVLSG